MAFEKQINEFVSRLRTQAGENLRSVILYGSAATGDFHSDFSNVNLLCVLRDADFAALAAIAPAFEWWSKQKHNHPPILVSEQELHASADVFSIEWLDMKQSYRVVYGEDVLGSLSVPMHLHAAQVEYELREKLILLRRHVLLSTGKDKRLWEILLASFSSFVTLFRHALIALGDPVPLAKREIIERLAVRIPLDPTALVRLLEVREGKAEAKQFDVREVCAGYLDAVQQVTRAVDARLEPLGPNSLPY
jgi:hypothetical protein